MSTTDSITAADQPGTATLTSAKLQTAAEAFDTAQASNFATCVAQVKAGDVHARATLCAGVLTAGFRNPFAATAIYDQLASTWLNQKLAAATVAAPSFDLADSNFTAQFWQALWQLIDPPAAGDSAQTRQQKMHAGDLTARVAALGGQLSPRFGELAEQLARSHPGAAAPHTKTPPPMTDLAALGSAPNDSLAGELHRMLVDNGYDAEVLDRQALGLAQLPPGLAYLNTRILQMHDVWHLAAGYRTTALHEIAISAFQLAQFGHNYSAMFLAVVLTTATRQQPEGLPILLQIISEAWLHGRTNSAFMAIEWEQVWHQPVAQLREEQGITPFTSSLPADLFETLAQARQ